MRWLPLRPGYDLTTWWVPKASQKHKNEIVPKRIVTFDPGESELSPRRLL
jgi:hypothetical protein